MLRNVPVPGYHVLKTHKEIVKRYVFSWPCILNKIRTESNVSKRTRFRFSFVQQGNGVSLAK